MLGEVSLDGVCVVTDISKVNSLATPCEQQEGVELGEEQRGRLMDGNQDG